MNILDAIGSSTIFVSTASQQARLEDLANKALSKAIDLSMNGHYKEAINEYKRSLGLAPHSANASNAANYMAQAYLHLQDTENAIKAYQTSIDLNPFRDDTHIALGSLYFSDNRFEKAKAEYAEAVKINPSAGNYFALGQANLSMGNYGEAERIFNTIRRIAPDKPDGNHGLGLVYARQGRFEKAVKQFGEAIKRDRTFYYAHAEMGYAYADMGEMELAMGQKQLLEKKDPLLALTLGEYIYRIDPPKIKLAYSDNFSYYGPYKTPVANLDTYLENANASKTFTMKFVFDKDMDRESVENRFNWKISRAAGAGPGEVYNFGMPLPSTEVNLSPYPLNVYYDAASFTATVKFSIQQNASADGTIDPSHIEFKFSGKDAYGLKMDIHHDQFTGFSGIA